MINEQRIEVLAVEVSTWSGIYGHLNNDRAHRVRLGSVEKEQYFLDSTAITSYVYGPSSRIFAPLPGTRTRGTVLHLRSPLETPRTPLDPDYFTDAQAIAAIERITRGNSLLLKRLFPQIVRVLKSSQLETITDDVIEAAASILVIGN